MIHWLVQGLGRVLIVSSPTLPDRVQLLTSCCRSLAFVALACVRMNFVAYVVDQVWVSFRLALIGLFVDTHWLTRRRRELRLILSQFLWISFRTFPPHTVLLLLNYSQWIKRLISVLSLDRLLWGRFEVVAEIFSRWSLWAAIYMS